MVEQIITSLRLRLSLKLPRLVEKTLDRMLDRLCCLRIVNRKNLGKTTYRFLKISRLSSNKGLYVNVFYYGF